MHGLPLVAPDAASFKLRSQHRSLSKARQAPQQVRRTPDSAPRFHWRGKSRSNIGCRESEELATLLKPARNAVTDIFEDT